MYRILVIDDEQSIRKALAMGLSSEDFEVDVAADGTNGILLGTQTEYDILIADLCLPDMDGLEVIRNIKRTSPEIIPIIITGRGSKESSIDAVRLHVSDYIEKPISLDSVKNSIKRGLEEREQAEQALRKNENLLADVLESIQDGISVLDSELNIIRVNQAMRKWYAHMLPIEGKKCYEVYQGLTEACEICPTIRAFKTGKMEMDEISFTAVDGATGTWEVFAFPMLDDSGKPMGVVEFIRDVTVRKIAEEALRESEEKYRLLVENANDAIYVAQDEVIKFSNPKTEELTGYYREELARIPFADLIHPEDRDMVLDRHKRRLKGQDLPGTYSFRIINRAGKELWVQLNCVLIEWEGGPATLNFLRDITREKSLETHLQQAQKMEALGTLSGGIAHDFNNILGVIIGCTELSLFDVPESNPAHQHMMNVLKAGNRAKELVKQILAFSRQSEQERKPLHPGIITKEALKMLRSSLPSTIQIQQDIRKDSGLILADPTQTHQILMNLCTNAAHAMRDKGGVLNVSLSNVDIGTEEAEQYPDLSQGPYLRLKVSDSGHGMTPEVMARIFDPYFTTKELGEGTGLGLAVVYGIVNSYGGTIKVYSEPGKGSTFQVLLPRIEHSKKAAEIEELSPIPVGNERILFVDDEETLADTGREILQRLGYQVAVRTSSIEALKLFRTLPYEFDLIITDQTMPNMTGAGLAKELMHIRPDIPIILCTGFSELISREQSKSMGIKEFVMKPFIMREIAETIRKVMDS